MPPAKPRLSDARVLYAVLALFCAIVVMYRVRNTAGLVDETVRGDMVARLPFDPDPPTFTLNDVEDEAAAAGLRAGDRLIAVEGTPLRGADDLFPRLHQARPDDVLRVSIERVTDGGTERHDAVIKLTAARSSPMTSGQWVTFAIAGIALPYLCTALGFWVAAVRIRDRLAWLLLLLLLGIAEFTGGNWRALWGHADWFEPIATIYQPVLANLWPLSMMLFGIYFPDRLTFDRRYPWAKWIVIVPVLFRVLGTNVAVDFLTLRNAAAAIPIEQTFRPTQGLVAALHFVAISVFFAALGRKTALEQRPDARRRLRLLHTGAFVAITPLLVAFLLGFGRVVELSETAVAILLAILFIFPLTMAYVIVVHRAMDVRLVVRQGVQYVLARGSIRALQVIGSVVIFFVAATLKPPGVAPSTGVIARFLPIGIGVIAIVAIGRFADRLRLWVDRRFFREAYNAEQVLGELARHVRTIVETMPLLETVAQRISTTLHVPRLAILLNNGGMLEPAYAVGYDAVAALPAASSRASSEIENDVRTALDAELVLPLAANQKLVGVIGLGPKQSEEPFTSADVRLLEAVAAQTGLALENSRLTAEIAVEIANREKARREIEIAREVQQRLFPQHYPPILGTEYCGACRPALGVGGDYYDFIARSERELGIAIGDVSGKGIPAALLMATLRAYLRGQTISGDHDLAAMMANLNALVYESSAPNRYATFFYGQYNAASGSLRYVNAGHNPPMLFKGSGTIVRLDTGGPVIGLIEGCAYEEGSACIEPGDVLVSFTDGISEAMNATHDEWGEERLQEAIARHRSLAPPALIDTLIAEADRFVGDAPQHDDMTIVVVKRHP